MRKRRCKKIKIKIRPLLPIITAAVMFLCLELSVRPVISEMASYSARISAAEMLNKAVLDEFQNFQRDFSNLVRIEYDSGGRINSIRTDTLAAGIFKGTM